MCGIIGMVGRGEAPVAPLLLEALARLEYRGYDSAGIATWSGGTLHRLRAEGKLARLHALHASAPVLGHIGIGHTRWATHGVPSEANAHPHATDRVAVVHNGIIENFETLRTRLMAEGHRFTSQTDSEVIPVLVTAYLDAGKDPEAAVAAALAELQGAYACALLFRDYPGLLIAARHGAPLVIGQGAQGRVLGSDTIALAGLADEVTYLEEGDWVTLTLEEAVIYQGNRQRVTRPSVPMPSTALALGKGHYAHFMQKEMYEQPAVVAETLAAWYDPAAGRFSLPPLPVAPNLLSRLHIVACGTSYFAGLTARYWLEQIARLPTDVEIASEFRYREPLLAPEAMTLVISQSGETADTLAALRYAGKHHPTLGVVNVAGSSIAREASAVLCTLAGPEIGVASTKAFTTQLATLACLTLALAEARGALAGEARDRLTQALLSVSSSMAEALQMEAEIQALAPMVAAARDVLYLGRGTSYAVAHEGALKLKEISYIHAEAYAAGEMKHGPIALIDEHVPIIAIAPRDALFEKTASNLQEAAARGGKIIVLSDAEGCAALAPIAQACLRVPAVHPLVAPLVYAIPVQLLAYHAALCRGADVDQPRNLAKSVTVE